MNKLSYISAIKDILENREFQEFEFKPNTKVNLKLFGEVTETILTNIYLNQDIVYLRSYPLDSSIYDDYDYDELSHFSLKECQEIYNIFIKQI